MGHTSQRDLVDKIEKARKKVSVGARYYHYKDPKKRYVVEAVGLLEESQEPCVVYRALYGEGILWVRTLKEFTKAEQTGNKEGKKFTLVRG